MLRLSALAYSPIENKPGVRFRVASRAAWRSLSPSGRSLVATDERATRSATKVEVENSRRMQLVRELLSVARCSVRPPVFLFLCRFGSSHRAAHPGRFVQGSTLSFAHSRRTSLLRTMALRRLQKETTPLSAMGRPPRTHRLQKCGFCKKLLSHTTRTSRRRKLSVAIDDAEAVFLFLSRGEDDEEIIPEYDYWQFGATRTSEKTNMPPLLAEVLKLDRISNTEGTLP